jgi:hypothetical protein
MNLANTIKAMIYENDASKNAPRVNRQVNPPHPNHLPSQPAANCQIRTCPSVMMKPRVPAAVLERCQANVSSMPVEVRSSEVSKSRRLLV